MNERTTNLTPDTPTNKSLNSDEFNFLQQFYIAEGSSGLLAHAACGEELENINDSVIASAAYSIQDAIGKMNEIFHGLLDHNLALQRQNKGTITATETILETGSPASNINEDDEDTSPNIKRHGPECEFNHQHLIAEGAAGLLFDASTNDQSIHHPTLNSVAYSLESSIREIKKCFQVQLKLDYSNNKKTIEEIREAETTRKDKIMELVDEFEDEHPHLRNDSIHAIKTGMTVEFFQGHVLRAISEKNFKLKNANQ